MEIKETKGVLFKEGASKKSTDNSQVESVKDNNLVQTFYSSNIEQKNKMAFELLERGFSRESVKRLLNLKLTPKHENG